MKEINTEIIDFLEKYTDKPSPSNNNYDFIIDNLNKTKKFISLGIQNENKDYHYATIQLLKSALDNLNDCINEIEKNKYRTNYKLEKLNFLKETIVKIAQIINDISKTNNLSQNNKTPKSVDSEIMNKPEQKENDWVISDFNLLSQDFNNELSILAGKLFDLSFNFKLIKVLNNNCFLMKTRHPTKIGSNSTPDKIQYFLLKVNFNLNQRPMKLNDPKIKLNLLFKL